MGAQEFGTGSRERIPYRPEGSAASGLSSCVGLRVVRGMVRSGNEDASLRKPGTQTYKHLNTSQKIKASGIQSSLNSPITKSCRTTVANGDGTLASF